MQPEMTGDSHWKMTIAVVDLLAVAAGTRCPHRSVLYRLAKSGLENENGHFDTAFCF
jgi:hypothetical protein